jgi:hypothetical protein
VRPGPRTLAVRDVEVDQVRHVRLVGDAGRDQADAGPGQSRGEILDRDVRQEPPVRPRTQQHVGGHLDLADPEPGELGHVEA